MTTIRRRIIAERAGDGGWLAMDDAGNVTWHATRAALVKAVRRNDRASVANVTNTVVVTAVEWRP